jgi:hypothetical protein
MREGSLPSLPPLINSSPLGPQPRTGYPGMAHSAVRTLPAVRLPHEEPSTTLHSLLTEASRRPSGLQPQSSRLPGVLVAAAAAWHRSHPVERRCHHRPRRPPAHDLPTTASVLTFRTHVRLAERRRWRAGFHPGKSQAPCALRVPARPGQDPTLDVPLLDAAILTPSGERVFIRTRSCSLFSL